MTTILSESRNYTVAFTLRMLNRFLKSEYKKVALCLLLWRLYVVEVDSNSLHLCPWSKGREVLVAAPPGHPRQLAGGRAGAGALHPRTHPHRGEARGHTECGGINNINKMSSIRCSGGSSPSAAVTRAWGATWQTRRSDIYNIYTSTIYIYISAQVHLPAVCRDSIENFFASGAAEAGTEQPHVKVPVA